MEYFPLPGGSWTWQWLPEKTRTGEMLLARWKIKSGNVRHHKEVLREPLLWLLYNSVVAFLSFQHFKRSDDHYFVIMDIIISCSSLRPAIRMLHLSFMQYIYIFENLHIVLRYICILECREWSLLKLYIRGLGVRIYVFLFAEGRVFNSRVFSDWKLSPVHHWSVFYRTSHLHFILHFNRKQKAKCVKKSKCVWKKPLLLKLW